MFLSTKNFCKMFLTSNICVWPGRVCAPLQPFIWQENYNVMNWRVRMDDKGGFCARVTPEIISPQFESLSAAALFQCQFTSWSKVLFTWRFITIPSIHYGATFIRRWFFSTQFELLASLAVVFLLQWQFITWLPFTADSHYQRGSRKETSEDEIFVGPLFPIRGDALNCFLLLDAC